MNSKAYHKLRDYIDKLKEQLATQSRYIAELEKQLEHASPGIVKEVQEFLEVKEGQP